MELPACYCTHGDTGPERASDRVTASPGRSGTRLWGSAGPFWMAECSPCARGGGQGGHGKACWAMLLLRPSTGAALPPAVCV